MSKDGFAGNKNNQYDPGLIAKEVADFYGQSIRVNNARSVADSYFTHFTVTYNVSNNPTEVTYFRGTKAHSTTVGFTADIAGSLNNKYFIIRSSPDNNQYYVWFNVDNTGTDPLVASSASIEINISTNDSAAIISAAVGLVINALFGKVFSAVRTGSTVEIKTAGLGICSNSSDFNTGFVISNSQGEQIETDYLLIGYSGADPIYGGQVLKGYKYNIWEGTFEFMSSGGGEGDASAANQVTQINQLQEVVDNIGIGILIPERFDRVQILAKNLNGDPTSVRYSSVGTQVALLTITYDVDGDITDVQRS